MLNWFRDTKLVYQINIIGLFAFIGFVVIAINFISSEQHLEEVQTELDHDLHALELSESIHYEFLNARRREKDFLLRYDLKYVQKHDEVMKKIDSEMKELMAMDVMSEKTKFLKIVNLMLKSYTKKFKEVSDAWMEIGLNEKEGLRGRLRKSVHNVEEKLKEFKNDKLTVTMLMMRRHEKDFFLRLAPKYVDRMDKRMAEFSGELIESGIPQASQDEIMGLLKSYIADFKLIAQKRISVQENSGKLSKIFAKAQKPFDKLVQDIIKKTDDASLAMKDTLSSTKLSILTIIGITMLIVFVVGVTVAKKITSPIHMLTDAMKRLADGEKDQDIPITKRLNELGEMGRSVLVFQESMIRADNLAAEQAAEQERQLDRSRQISEMTSEFETNSEGVLSMVNTAVTQMGSTADGMKSAADQLNESSSVVSAAATEASANVQTVASASEELAASIQEIGTQAENSTRIAGEAVIKAEETNKTVGSLSQSA